MKVYLAGWYFNKIPLHKLKSDLAAHEIDVTSRWVDAPHLMDVSTATDEVERHNHNCQMGQEDVEDIDKADVLVLYHPVESHKQGRGGRHWETGYAWGQKKPIVLVGDPENIFHYLPRVIVIPESELIPTLLELRKCLIS